MKYVSPIRTLLVQELNKLETHGKKLVKMLLYFFEKEFNSIYVYTYGLIFLIGRLMYGFCFAFTKQNMFLGVGGIVLTFRCILSLAIILLTNFLN